MSGTGFRLNLTGFFFLFFFFFAPRIQQMQQATRIKTDNKTNNATHPRSKPASIVVVDEDPECDA